MGPVWLIAAVLPTGWLRSASVRRVAFLRGINVGGHNKVPMTELRAAMADAGFSDVATLIQSGNVAFHSSLPDQLATDTIRELIADRFDVDTPVLIRSRDQVSAALEHHPWAPGELDPKFHHIVFLAGPPPSDAETRLSERALTEDIAVVGADLHVRYREGQARSKFTIDWIDRCLDTTASGRNLNTVGRVLALLDG